MKHRCLSLLFLLLLAGVGTAQTTTIAGSGCASLGFPSQTGSPSLGQAIQTTFQCASRSEIPWFVVGLPIAPTPINTGLTCSQVCTQACSLVFAAPGQQWDLTIPNSAHLVGLCVCVQFACIDLSFGCVTASGALQTCIQP